MSCQVERQQTLGQKWMQPGNTRRKRHETTICSKNKQITKRITHTDTWLPGPYSGCSGCKCYLSNKVLLWQDLEFGACKISAKLQWCVRSGFQTSTAAFHVGQFYIRHLQMEIWWFWCLILDSVILTWSTTHSKCRRRAINNSWASLVHWNICAVAAALHILQYLCQGVGGQIWKLGASSKPLMSSISTAQPRAFSSLSHHPCRIPNLEVLHPDLSSHTSGTQSNLHVNSMQWNLITGIPTGKTMLEGSQRRCGRRKGLLQHLVPAQDQTPKTGFCNCHMVASEIQLIHIKPKYFQGILWIPQDPYVYMSCFSMNEQLLAAALSSRGKRPAQVNTRQWNESLASHA